MLPARTFCSGDARAASLRQERTRPPRFLENPSSTCPALRPRWIIRHWPERDGRYGLPLRKRRRLHKQFHFEAQSRSLPIPCVRFGIEVALKPRNTRFRWMASPFRVGTCTRQGSNRRFQSSAWCYLRYSPPPGFAWRTFRGNVHALRRRNDNTGLGIAPDTPIPLWEGEKMDDSMAVEALLWLESRQNSGMIRGDAGVDIDQMF